MSDLQYIRKISLLIADDAGDALELGQMRVTFEVKKTDSETPNSALIRIYNLERDTANRIQKEFTRVTLSAGYESNFGVIFAGNFRQVRQGKKSGTDTFVEIAAGDGDEAYAFSVVSTTLAAGASQEEQIRAATTPMAGFGVTKGFTQAEPVTRLARGKVMYGASRDYIRQSAKTLGATWSIQDGKLQIVSRTSTTSVPAVVLTSATGLIGTPAQTTDGIDTVMLLNPLVTIGGRIVIDQGSIEVAAADDADKKPSLIAADGIYRVLSTVHSGDTFGTEWYTRIACVSLDDTQDYSKKVVES